jgi:hypothetical protein
VVGREVGKGRKTLFLPDASASRCFRCFLLLSFSISGVRVCVCVWRGRSYAGSIHALSPVCAKKHERKNPALHFTAPRRFPPLLLLFFFLPPVFCLRCCCGLFFVCLLWLVTEEPLFRVEAEEGRVERGSVRRVRSSAASLLSAATTVS